MYEGNQSSDKIDTVTNVNNGLLRPVLSPVKEYLRRKLTPATLLMDYSVVSKGILTKFKLIQAL